MVELSLIVAHLGLFCPSQSMRSAHFPLLGAIHSSTAVLMLQLIVVPGKMYFLFTALGICYLSNQLVSFFKKQTKELA